LACEAGDLRCSKKFVFCSLSRQQAINIPIVAHPHNTHTHTMSTETMANTPKAAKTKKSKDDKSAKKRRHDEQATAAAEEASETTIESLPKRPRIASPAAEADTTSTSPFVKQTSSFYLPLSPIYHAFPVDGLCAEHISPLLLTYHPPLGGVILSYSNPRLSNTPANAPSSRDGPDASPTVLAKSIDEYAVSFIWLTVDFILLRPTPGAVIEGYVSLQNESYLGLVCWNFFNAGVDRKRIPSTWKWVPNHNANAGTKSSTDWMRGLRNKSDESSGHYVDENGKKIEGKVKFTVKDFESAPSTERERGFLSIEGTLLSPEEDRAYDKELKAARKVPKKKRVPALNVNPEY
jgi:DNA-directed RNA polymerase I subunit RPA43